MKRGEVPPALRRLIVEVKPATINVAEFCRIHGISTWFFWDLRRRWDRDGDAVLEPTSRAPHTVANRTPAALEDEIITLRKELGEAGLDNGPATIAFHLAGRTVGPVPSEATVWRVLKRHGVIEPDPSKAPKHTGRSFTAERANECWQIDDTPWELADGTVAKIINVIDDRSRVLIVSMAVLSCTSAAAFSAFTAGAARWGWPARFLSDNARAFRHGLAEALRALGVAAGHSRPYHPQTCGKVERFHQTLKKWLAKQPPAETIEELQVLLDTFTELYNHHRPHRSLGRRFPAVVWHESPKSGPADHPLGAPTFIHHGRVLSAGTLGLRSWVITLGAHYGGLEVTTILTGLRAHVFHAGELIRSLTIDPARRHQPLQPNGVNIVRDVSRQP